MLGYTTGGSKPVPTRFTEEQLNWLDEQANNGSRTVSDIIRQALIAFGMPKARRKPSRRKKNVDN